MQVYTLDAATVAEINRMGALAARERDAQIALYHAERALADLRRAEERFYALSGQADDLPRALAYALAAAEDGVAAAQRTVEAVVALYQEEDDLTN